MSDGSAPYWPSAAPLATGALVAGASAGGAWAGPPLLAVAFGAFEWAMVTADARLQSRVGDEARATVTSFAGFASECGAVLLFAAYAGLPSPAVFYAAASAFYVILGTGLTVAARQR